MLRTTRRCSVAQRVSSCRVESLRRTLETWLSIRLDGEVEPGGDLFVHVAARDQSEHFAFARCEFVEFGVAADAVAGAESVGGEPREAG